MSKYLVYLNDFSPFEVEGDSPRDAFSKKYPNFELQEISDKGKAQVCIELVGGKRKSVNYYYIENVKGSTINVIVAKNNMDDSGVEVAGVFVSTKLVNMACELVKNWQQTNGFNDGEVYVEHLEFNKLKWYNLNTRIKRTVVKKRPELHLVTAKNNRDDSGVEVAGIFLSEIDANKACKMIKNWQKKHGFNSGLTFTSKVEIDILSYYDLKIKLYPACDHRHSVVIKEQPIQ